MSSTAHITALHVHHLLQLEGEDPNAVPDEPALKRQQSDGSRGAAAALAAADSDGSPPPIVPTSQATVGGRLADAWQAPNSLFALLAEAKPAASVGAKQADGDHNHKKEKHKHKKEKKEKHSKKDKVGSSCDLKHT